jgi:glycosyltransferase involved in cell wall biosynthesis
MRILLLAPHPFYQERGTPIAVDLLLNALAERGHSVDVLTYHEGEDRDHGPNVRIFRIRAPIACRGIRPGFSHKKVISDIYLYRQALQMVRRQSYDVIHAVEEAAFLARWIKQKFSIPYVFDMDSSMPIQIVDGLPFLRPLLSLMKRYEAQAIRDALAITAVCDALADIAREAGAEQIFLLRDVPLLTEPGPLVCSDSDRSVTPGKECSFVYIGNLEAYQGIDLLLEAFARLPAHSTAKLVIVGGVAKHIDRYQRKARDLGIQDKTHFTGPRPISELPSLMARADVLVSPRIKGQNTPMKIYSYMASGKALLATDLPTHTQVLTHDSAKLVAPTPRAFADAMQALSNDASLRQSLGLAARKRVEEKYSLPVFQKTVSELYAFIERSLKCHVLTP